MLAGTEEDNRRWSEMYDRAYRGPEIPEPSFPDAATLTPERLRAWLYSTPGNALVVQPPVSPPHPLVRSGFYDKPGAHLTVPSSRSVR